MRTAAQEKAINKVEQLLKKYGYDPDEARRWNKRYNQLRNNAKDRGVVCLLSFSQYLRLAKKAGITEYEEIGNHLGQYQMARIGDQGNYEWGNVRFLTKEDNLREMAENGGNAARATKMRGRTKETHSGVARQAKKLRGRSAETHAHVNRTAEARRGTRKETHEFIANMALKKSKSFIAVSPSGKKFRGVNLREFCQTHDLNQGNMAAVCRGVKPHAKGWTGRYT